MVVGEDEQDVRPVGGGGAGAQQHERAEERKQLGHGEASRVGGSGTYRVLSTEYDAQRAAAHRFTRSQRRRRPAFRRPRPKNKSAQDRKRTPGLIQSQDVKTALRR